jgi:hypothetical protein
MKINVQGDLVLAGANSFKYIRLNNSNLITQGPDGENFPRNFL